jgi:hypothetical protein
VPDLFIPQWRLWIEMKAIKGRVSPEQESWAEYLRAANHVVSTCYGHLDAIEVVTALYETKEIAWPT